MKIGNRLLDLRKKSGMSQEEVAEKLNVTRQTVSKWETDQSTPDFDKIAPLCNLFGITTDALLNGTNSVKTTSESMTNMEQMHTKQKTAMIVSASVFIYILSVIWIILSEELFNLEEGITVTIFLLICAIPTSVLIYHFMTLPKHEKVEVVKSKQKKKFEVIDNALAIVTTVIYFVISFWTMGWGYTWIIWLIYAALIEIIHLIISLKDGDFDEK